LYSTTKKGVFMHKTNFPIDTIHFSRFNFDPRLKQDKIEDVLEDAGLPLYVLAVESDKIYVNLSFLNRDEIIDDFSKHLKNLTEGLTPKA
jgi:hypothetical protein